MSNIVVFGAIAMFLLWLMWDEIKRSTSPAEPSGDQFTFSCAAKDHANLTKLIGQCDSSELLRASYQLILIFQQKYKDLKDTEQRTKELFRLFDLREAAMSLPNRMPV